jgi:hypothetical protein
VGALQNGLVVTGTSQFLQQVFLGATLIAAVALDDTIRQFAHRAWAELPTRRERAAEQPEGDAETTAPPHETPVA